MPGTRTGDGTWMSSQESALKNLLGKGSEGGYDE